MTTAKPFARIGADESADVVLPQGGLPRRALYLHATEEGVFWVNLAELADAEGPLRGWLSADEAIPFGPYRISARLDGNGRAFAVVRPDLCAKGTLPEPQPSVVIAFSDQPVARRRLSRRLTLVGRRRPCALRIGSQDLSAAHLVLYWEAGTIWAVDLLSRTGTKLDGETIEASPLPAGSSLTAGEVKLKYGQFVGWSSSTDSTIPLGQPRALEETAPEISPVTIRECRAEESSGVLSAVVTLAESAPPRGDPLQTREDLRWEREQWLREQTEWIVQWRRRVEELDAREAAFSARQQAWEEARTQQDQELARRAEHHRAELGERLAELESARDRLEVEQLALEQRRAGFEAERQAVDARPCEDSRQGRMPFGGPAVVRQNAPSSTPVPKPSTETRVASPENGPSNRDSSDDDPDARYDQVMDRLFRVSRARRGWWSRFRSAFSRRSANHLPFETRDTAESDDSSGDPQ